MMDVTVKRVVGNQQVVEQTEGSGHIPGCKGPSHVVNAGQKHESTLHVKARLPLFSTFCHLVTHLNQPQLQRTSLLAGL